VSAATTLRSRAELCRQLNFYSFRKVLDEDDESGGYLAPTKLNTFEYR
jgi:hypothetical protein